MDSIATWECVNRKCFGRYWDSLVKRSICRITCYSSDYFIWFISYIIFLLNYTFEGCSWQMNLQQVIKFLFFDSHNIALSLIWYIQYFIDFSSILNRVYTCERQTSFIIFIFVLNQVNHSMYDVLRCSSHK